MEDNRDWCEYIYHKKGIEFSDGYGNKIYIFPDELEDKKID